MSSSAKPSLDTPASAPSTTPAELGLGAMAVVIDPAGIIVAAEPICGPLFQWEPAELVGQPLEVLLLAGTDRIRQRLVPDQVLVGPEPEGAPHYFALAQRKDGTTYPVAVTLELRPPNAGCWWGVSFHDVNSSALGQAEHTDTALIRAGLPPRRSRAQVGGPFALDGIPDIFQRAPAEPSAESEAPAPVAAPAPEPIFVAKRAEPKPEPPAPAAPAPAPAPANAETSKPEGRVQDLEQRLSRSAADLKRTQSHLKRQDEQLHAANAAAQQAMSGLKDETTRRTQLEEQLSQALQAGEELNQRLAAELQARTETEARLQELEQRLSQSAEELQRAQAQTQAPAPVPAPAPAPAPASAEPDPALQDQVLELESRLRNAVTSLARTTAELETERGERRRSEQRATGLASRMQQLHEELKSHLETEQTDRQRLAKLEEQLHEQTQQNDLSVAKLQSALQLEQCERKRLEADLLRSRALSSDSARAGRAQVNSLRRQLQPPVESLHQSACRLLQLQLSEDQKQLVQGMLENTLLLQTSLQESPES